MSSIFEVKDALAVGEYKQAATLLQSVLRDNPSADAWFMAAQLTLDNDRDRAIRHLKRALLLNPKHGDTLTLLGQLGEDRHITAGDVAEELGDVVDEQVDHLPFMKGQSRGMKLAVMGLLTMLVIVAVLTLPRILFPRTGPAYIPDAPPQVAELEIHSSNSIFNAFTSSGLEMFNVRFKNGRDAGKQTLEFQMPGRAGQLQPVQVIVYQSMTAVVRDMATHQQLDLTSETVMIDNVLLAYHKDLSGLIIEGQLRNQFTLIMGE
jgi:tetratricopeptide (TPR) repeat protein